MTSFPLSKFIAASGTDAEDTVLRTKKIKLRLTSNQKQMLQKWNSHARYTYNLAVWRLNVDIDTQTKLNLRNQITPANCNNGKEWILQTPKEIRARAVFEAHTRFCTGVKQIKNKTIKFFRLRYKDKKYQHANGWSIDIPKQAILQIDTKTLFIYKRITKEEKFKLGERLDVPIEHDCKIHFDGDAYYLIVPFNKKKKTREQDGIVSLDPGVRTFLTGVDGDKTIELGKDSGTILFRKLRHLDHLISKKDKTRDKTVKKILKKRIKKVRIYIRNLQDELHKKTSTWLCKKYSNVVIPQFGSKDMVKKQDRKLKTKTVRAMSILAHSRFLERLKNKAREWRTDVVIVDEKYTSKTCSVCGHVKTKRFRNVYNCESCLMTMDRDRNGAINILKKLFLPKGENRADRANETDTLVRLGIDRGLFEPKPSSHLVVSVCQ
ncbi:transposase [bacterium]|nr:transposase [bacterium]NDD83637.1 transposase [bacterium]NDG32521.1 transposase [bacterium]